MNASRINRLNVKALFMDGAEVTATPAQLNAVGAVSTPLVTLAGVQDRLSVVAGASNAVSYDRTVKVAVKAITGAALHAGTLNWQNPEAGAIAVRRAILDITTKTSGACTLNIGTTATSATQASDTLIDGLDANAATGMFDSLKAADAGTNGLAYAQRLATGKWVTIQEASGNATGLAANLYIEYLVL